MGACWLTLSLLLCLAQPVQDEDPLLEQARTLRRASRLDEAITLLQQARPSRPHDDELDGLLGGLLLDAGREAEALTVASPWAGYDGEGYRAHLLQARVSERQGDAERALLHWRRAEKLKDRPVEALVGQIALLRRQGRLGAALKRAQNLAGLHAELGGPLLAEILLEQGDRFLAQGAEQMGHAVERFQQALAAQPQDREVFVRLADTLLLSSRIEDAQALIGAQLSAQQDTVEKLFWLGRCHEAGRDFGRARQAYLAVRERDPQHAASALQLARLQLSDGDHQGARNWLAAASADGDRSARTLSLLAEVHLGLGELSQAEALLRQVRALSPNDTGAAYQLARVLYQQGRRDEGAAAMATFAELQRRTLQAQALDDSDGDEDG